MLLLSAAGIYALMSFTVHRRRREIGIRAALGAQPGRLLAVVYRRALRQLGAGAACGILAAFLVRRTLPIVEGGGWEIPGVIPAATLLMVAIGLLAALGPSRSRERAPRRAARELRLGRLAITEDQASLSTRPPFAPPPAPRGHEISTLDEAASHV